jgi:hypothetical protein
MLKAGGSLNWLPHDGWQLPNGVQFFEDADRHRLFVMSGAKAFA